VRIEKVSEFDAADAQDDEAENDKSNRDNKKDKAADADETVKSGGKEKINLFKKKKGGDEGYDPGPKIQLKKWLFLLITFRRNFYV